VSQKEKITWSGLWRTLVIILVLTIVAVPLLSETIGRVEAILTGTLLLFLSLVLMDRFEKRS
jgi:hypothetical protein